MRGQVTPFDEAVVPLQVRAADGQVRNLRAVVDTGFTGYLTLPLAEVIALGLSLQQRQTYRLADNSTVEFDAYLGTVVWDGHDRDIAVLASEGEPLIGMRLLRGHHLFMDVVDGGDVVIEARP